MAHVLLLNPPVPHRAVLRDYACGESTKADYYWAPIDLLVLSGVLESHELMVEDAVAVPAGPNEVLERAAEFRPDAVFTLTAAVTLAQDDAFLWRLKERTGARIYGLGDVGSFEPVASLGKTRAFDGFVQNFADPTLSRLADGKVDGVSSVVLRRGGGVDVRETVLQSPLRYPLPKHHLFPLHRYRMPFTRWTRTTSILTSYGCPFPCTFCPSRHLPYQLREIDDVIDELKAVSDLGIDEVYIRDFTFGPTRRRARELCEAIIASGLRLRWSAECRLDVLDEDLLTLMRRAGCEVILCGVETGDKDVSRLLGKKFAGDRTHLLLAHARALGIRSCGHFVLGSPGETREQIERTIAFASALPLDYASFNLYAPRLGSNLRGELVSLGRVDANDFGGQDVSAQANAFADMPGSELRQLFLKAVLSFYLRPRRAARLLRVTPWSALARQGIGVFRNLLDSRS